MDRRHLSEKQVRETRRPLDRQDEAPLAASLDRPPWSSSALKIHLRSDASPANRDTYITADGASVLDTIPHVGSR